MLLNAQKEPFKSIIPHVPRETNTPKVYNNQHFYEYKTVIGQPENCIRLPKARHTLQRCNNTL